MNVFQYDNDIAYSMLILLITVQTLYKSEEQETRVIWWNLDHPSISSYELLNEIWMICGNKPELAWFALGLIQNCTQVWSLRFTRNSYFSRYSFISRWLTWLFTWIHNTILKNDDSCLAAQMQNLTAFMDFQSDSPTH